MCDHGVVPVDKLLPFAFRATAYFRTSRWLRRRVRAFRYDVIWPDGHIDCDIDLVEVMYRRAPADYAVMKRAMHDESPEVGTGPWVWYSYGLPIEVPIERFLADNA
jgi:hypothetical protein